MVFSNGKILFCIIYTTFSSCYNELNLCNLRERKEGFKAFMKKKFVWGVATSAYQVEGAVREDGRTPSIWDTFCAQPGKIDHGDTGEIACDHYHHYKEDIRLMSELGIDSYRFSISWPRIFPEKGRYNPDGMRFYQNVIAELKKYGITAAVTLYHWDLPQWAEDLGGWLNRECVDWFEEFARKCFEKLDADVSMWITHNEPWCASFLSYYIGAHAPGKHGLEQAMIAAHHMMLSHGRAVRVYRAMGGKHPIGITLNSTPVYAATDTFPDQLARSMQEGYQNRWFLDPLFRKSYPTDMAALFAAQCGTRFAFLQPGDLECIAEPIDFIGLNFYSHCYVNYDPASPILIGHPETDYPKTDIGWDIHPEALERLVRDTREYTSIPIYITENGSAWDDRVENGCVHDQERVDYLRRHLEEVDHLNQMGLGIQGYFSWSFLDNFEWANGYSKRFGLVYVDYKTLKRIPKDSFYAYRDWIQAFRKR